MLTICCQQIENPVKWNAAMHNRTPPAAARDHKTHPGGPHEKFMCVAFEARRHAT